MKFRLNECFQTKTNFYTESQQIIVWSVKREYTVGPDFSFTFENIIFLKMAFYERFWANLVESYLKQCSQANKRVLRRDFYHLLHFSSVVSENVNVCFLTQKLSVLAENLCAAMILPKIWNGDVKFQVSKTFL